MQAEGSSNKPLQGSGWTRVEPTKEQPKSDVLAKATSSGRRLSVGSSSISDPARVTAEKADELGENTLSDDQSSSVRSKVEAFRGKAVASDPANKDTKGKRRASIVGTGTLVKSRDDSDDSDVSSGELKLSPAQMKMMERSSRVAANRRGRGGRSRRPAFTTTTTTTTTTTRPSAVHAASSNAPASTSATTAATSKRNERVAHAEELTPFDGCTVLEGVVGDASEKHRIAQEDASCVDFAMGFQCQLKSGKQAKVILTCDGAGHAQPKGTRERMQPLIDRFQARLRDELGSKDEITEGTALLALDVAYSGYSREVAFLKDVKSHLKASELPLSVENVRGAVESMKDAAITYHLKEKNIDNTPSNREAANQELAETNWGLPSELEQQALIQMIVEGGLEPTPVPMGVNMVIGVGGTATSVGGYDGAVILVPTNPDSVDGLIVHFDENAEMGTNSCKMWQDEIGVGCQAVVVTDGSVDEWVGQVNEQLVANMQFTDAQNEAIILRVQEMVDASYQQDVVGYARDLMQIVVDDNKGKEGVLRERLEPDIGAAGVDQLIAQASGVIERDPLHLESSDLEQLIGEANVEITRLDEQIGRLKQQQVEHEEKAYTTQVSPVQAQRRKAAYDIIKEAAGKKGIKVADVPTEANLTELASQLTPKRRVGGRGGGRELKRAFSILKEYQLEKGDAGLRQDYTGRVEGGGSQTLYSSLARLSEQRAEAAGERERCITARANCQEKLRANVCAFVEQYKDGQGKLLVPETTQEDLEERTKQHTTFTVLYEMKRIVETSKEERSPIGLAQFQQIMEGKGEHFEQLREQVRQRCARGDLSSKKGDCQPLECLKIGWGFSRDHLGAGKGPVTAKSVAMAAANSGRGDDDLCAAVATFP